MNELHQSVLLENESAAALFHHRRGKTWRDNQTSQGNVCASKLPASKLHYWQFQRKDQTNRKHNSWSKDHAVTFLDMGYQKLANSLQKNS